MREILKDFATFTLRRYSLGESLSSTPTSTESIKIREKIKSDNLPRATIKRVVPASSSHEAIKSTGTE